MQKFALLLTMGAALATQCAWAQSMLESSAVLAGSTIGSAAGKKVSEGITTSLKKTGGILDAASKTGASKTRAKQAKAAPAGPLLQVGAGVPKYEQNNVPPPPPRRIPVSKPSKPRPVSVPPVMSAVLPEPPPIPSNVDLTSIHNGMIRDSVLALGNPSARITMYEDGHILEIYQYRNSSLPSGTVRLRDGAVWAIEARR